MIALVLTYPLWSAGGGDTTATEIVEPALAERAA